jgi:aryl-alcohol dehydrogenase-like predicted oxidoreductase
MMRAIAAITSPVSAETMKIVNTRLVAKIEQLASARGVTLAQIALAWLHHRSMVHGLSVVPIPGTRKRPCLSASAAHLTHIAQRLPVRA